MAEAHVVLTRREFEVAMLVADGRTNKTIAQNLQISIRTVESMIRKAYQRLNVSIYDERGSCRVRLAAAVIRGEAIAPPRQTRLPLEP